MIARMLALAAAFASTAALAAPDLAGMWWIKDRSQTAAIKADQIPFLPAAKALYAKNRAVLARPPKERDCLPEGTPRLMLSRYPFQILQKPEQLTMLFERQHMVRFVYMGRPIPADLDPTYLGFSAGTWAGDALVVETAAFNDVTMIDGTGIPHSDAMRLSERFTLIDGGQTLRDEVTVTDPKSFSRPWSFAIDFARAPGIRLMEDVCTFAPPQRDTMPTK